MKQELHDLADSFALRQELASRDINVPSRMQGRTKAHVETSVAFRVIAALNERGHLCFPFSATAGRDPPDYAFDLGGQSVGVEITQAITTTEGALYAALSRQREKVISISPDDDLTGEHKRRERRKLVKEIIERDVRSTPGWVGNEPEKRLAARIIDCLARKAGDVQCWLPVYEKKWLLIYATSGSGCPEPDETVELCRDRIIGHLDESGGFDRILVQLRRSIADFVRGQVSFIDEPDLWDRP